MQWFSSGDSCSPRESFKTLQYITQAQIFLAKLPMHRMTPNGNVAIVGVGRLLLLLVNHARHIPSGHATGPRLVMRSVLGIELW